MQNEYDSDAKCVQMRCKIHTKAMQNAYKGHAKCGVTDDLNSLYEARPTHFVALCTQSSQLWLSAPVYLAFEVGPDLHSFFVHRLGHGQTGETLISPKQTGPIKIKFHLAFLSQVKVIRM